MKTALTERDLERIARRRAGARMGWYIHAGVYMVVTTGLGLLSVMGGKSWAIYPALGRGLGVAIHGLVVFFATGGHGLYERLVQQERERLAPQREPW